MRLVGSYDCANIKLFDQVHTFDMKTEEDYALLRILLSLLKYRGSELGVSATKDALELAWWKWLY